jgi:hypothetical protein
MRLIDRMSGRTRVAAEQRYTVDDLANWLNYGGHRYPIGFSMKPAKVTDPDGTFLSMLEDVYRRQGVVSSAIVARALLLSQLRFVWRNTSASSTPGRVFGSASLSLLEQPANMSRSQFLYRLEQDASLAGTAYVWRDGDGMLRRLRPDRIGVLLASDAEKPDEVDETNSVVEAYVYYRKASKQAPVVLPADEVAPWIPEPDPEAYWRGMSWVQSVIREVQSDDLATKHKRQFFEHGATPNLVFTLEARDVEIVKEFRRLNEDATSGVGNAYRNMYLGAGADVKQVGASLKDIDYSALQGSDETRIAARARVPATILGIKEGLQGSSLNAGNYSAARRMLSDGWFTPTAESLCEALQKIVPVPPGGAAELSFDPSRVMFLQEDGQDAATIMQTQAQALRALIDGGFTPDAAVEAVKNGDLSLLAGNHTGLVSVQLLAPGTGAQPSTPADPEG